MRLKTFRITGCFGFVESGEVELDPPGGITFLLGRNSSGKTSFLQALRHLEHGEVPSKYKNFTNYNPTLNQRAFIIGKFSVDPDDFKDVSPASGLKTWIGRAGILPNLISEDTRIQTLLQTTNHVYDSFFEALRSSGQVWVHKNAEGSYFFLSSPNDSSYQERKKQITTQLQAAFPNGKFKVKNEEFSVAITAQQIENNLFLSFPNIVFFGDSYRLNEDLPDRITAEDMTSPNSSLEKLFVGYLGKEDVSRFLEANDPDERDALLEKLRERAKALCVRINKEAPLSQRVPGLINIVLHEKDGLQITLKADEKKAFYRHLSENTKMLIAYHLHTLAQDIEGDILLFDEPSTGFHPTAQAYLLEFLQSLANSGNQVIISSHSEYMVDLDALAGVRLMQSSESGTLSVANHPYRRARSSGAMLALQPIMDAIGLRYGMGITLGRDVTLTEGVSDLLYLRAFNRIRGNSDDLAIAPARGDSSLYTLIAFLIGQGVGIKLVIDAGGLRSKIQAAYDIPDEFIFEVPVPEAFKPNARTSGIEDLFSKNDFYGLATQLGIDVGNQENFGKVPNSHAMRKHPGKRVLAHEFLASIGSLDWDFDDETLSNFASVLGFCARPKGFTL